MSGDTRKNSQKQFTLTIQCPWCGHAGSSVWEETPTGRKLVSIDGFYERLRSFKPLKIETVCNRCDKAQPL